MKISVQAWGDALVSIETVTLEPGHAHDELGLPDEVE